MVEAEEGVVITKVVHDDFGISNIVEGQGGLNHHNDCMTRRAFGNLTVLMFNRDTIFRVYIKQRLVVDVGLDLVNPDLIDGLFVFIEQHDLVFVSVKDRTHQLAVIEHDRNGFVIVLLKELKLYQELFLHSSVDWGVCCG